MDSWSEPFKFMNQNYISLSLLDKNLNTSSKSLLTKIVSSMCIHTHWQTCILHLVECFWNPFCLWQCKSTSAVGGVFLGKQDGRIYTLKSLIITSLNLETLTVRVQLLQFFALFTLSLCLKAFVFICLGVFRCFSFTTDQQVPRNNVCLPE